MHHEASLTRLVDLIRVTATEDPAAAQRLAAHAVAVTLRRGGATVELGGFDGHVSAEVLGVDGRRALVVPLCEGGRWKYAARDVDGALVARNTWFAADHGLDLAAGAEDFGRLRDAMSDLLDWCLVLGADDPIGRVRPGQPAADFAVDPYPGQRPYGSFVIDRSERCWPVHPDEGRPSGWRVEAEGGHVCLDAWLGAAGAMPMAGRVPLLGYGSNASPGKVVANATPLPSVHLACVVEDLASVWCVGDTGAGRTPVTLEAAPGHREEAVVMMVDDAELGVLDRVEGRAGRWYDLVLLGRGGVVLENGARVPRPAAYVGGRDERRPMLVGGRPVLRVDVDQAEVRSLRARVSPGARARADDLGTVVPVGTWPHPGECIPQLFAYGTLKPGHERHRLLAARLVSEPEALVVAGDLRDTGRGYPALNAAGDRKAPGVLCRFQPDAMADLLEVLDRVEGVALGLFSRQVRSVEGRAAWVYVAASVAGAGVPVEAW